MKTSFMLTISLSISLYARSQTIDTLIDVGGYQLHFNIIKGKGIPVLFESGGGNDGTIWKPLLKSLFDSIGAPLITYDRAGTGKSGIDTANINIVNEVKGLETALDKLGYSKSLFLVAHSLGGSYSILFSARNSDKIKGCVFIDINLPCFMTKQKAKELKETYANKMESFKKENIGVYYLLKNYENTNDVLRETIFPPQTPATVIGSDSTTFTGADSIKWKQCVKDFGNQPNHTYILAKHCGHYVFKDNPSLVIDAIIKLYRKNQ